MNSSGPATNAVSSSTPTVVMPAPVRIKVLNATRDGFQSEVARLPGQREDFLGKIERFPVPAEVSTRRGDQAHGFGFAAEIADCPM